MFETKMYLTMCIHINSRSRLKDWAILFIQMQLCYQTLRQWLDVRNIQQNSPINIDESLHIFSQIVRGVEFIHSKGIVHHDIKVNLRSHFL